MISNGWLRYPLIAVSALCGVVVVWLVIASIVYSPEYVRRVLVWQQSDQSDYLHNFPLRELTASPRPVRLDERPDPRAHRPPSRVRLRCRGSR